LPNGNGAPAPVAALDKAFANAAAELMSWAAHTIAGGSDSLEAPKGGVRKRANKE
jgi:hypothetical protein